MEKDIFLKIISRYNNLVVFLTVIIFFGAVFIIANPFPIWVTQKDKTPVLNELVSNNQTTVSNAMEEKDLFAIDHLKKLEFLDSSNPYEAQVLFGYELITNTNSYLGPESDNPMAGNHLNCTNCHLKSGTQKFAAPFIGVFSSFPQYRGRENQVGDLKDRINGCMERSMNGKKLDKEAPEMKAMVTYMHWLSNEAVQGEKLKGKGFPKFDFPNRRADLNQGKLVYEAKCQSCHQKDALGVKREDGAYQYPPLAGEDSYNDGAGMHRVLTAATFIKNNMPLGVTEDNPQLSDDEAFDVAAYINSLKRPEKSNKELDFPVREKKPMSTSYGPWADDFSAEQHKYGPYQEIKDFYNQKFNIIKNK